MTSCFTCIRAIAFIPIMDYDLVFLSISACSLTLVLNEDAYSFATHSFAFCSNCSFRCRVCSIDSSSLSAGMKKSSSFSTISEVDVVTSMGVVCMSSQFLRRIFSVTMSSSLEKKSAAVLTEPEMWANLKLNCNTVTCAPQRWCNCFRIGESCGWFSISQYDRWLCCFPKHLWKLERCVVYCQEFFRVDGHFELRWGEIFQSERPGGVYFQLWLYFPVWVILDYEGITSASDDDVSHDDILSF